MAVTTEMREQVTQLYVALFNRAPDSEGLGYWTQQLAAGASVTDVANAMYGTEPARKTYPLFLTNEEIVSSFYQNVLGRAADAEGLAYWTAKLNDGTPGEVIAEMIDVVANYDGEDPAGLDSAALFANKVAVGEYFAFNVGTIAGSDAALNGITADPASVQDAIDALNGGGTGGTPTADTQLTVRWDNLSGTAGNDVFTARVVQDDMGSGAQTNQLGSGDTINGQGGTDILDAKVTAGVFSGGGGGGLFGSGSMPIHPETTSVEIIRLGAMESGIGGGLGGIGGPIGQVIDSLFGGHGDNTQVYVNAQNMYGVNEISSYYSDADLSVLNMTTLANDGQTMRAVNDMTVSMVHTGNSDSRWGASDFAVLFDQDYLVPVESSKSTAFYWLLDEDADLAGLPNRLDHINVDGIRFTVDGGPIITLANPDAQTAGTHEAFVAELQGALAQAIADGLVPADTTLTLDYTNTRTTFLDDGSSSGPVPAITLHTESSVTFEPVGFSQVEDALGEYDVWGRFSNEVETDQNLSINVVLEKAGRAGDGGELQIGSMHKDAYDYDSDEYGHSQYPNSWDSDYAHAGIPTFNVTVKGDASKPSSLSGLHSTNNVLETINVTTDSAVTGVNGYASLQIGNPNTSGYGIWDVATVDARTFKGDFSLDAYFGASSKYGGAVDLNYTFGSGNDTLWLDLDPTSSQKAKYHIDMGDGNDNVVADIDGDAVDAVTESFHLDLGNGDNWADLWVGDGVSFATTNLLRNLSVTAGSGADEIEISGVGRWNVKAGGGSDFVYIDAGGGHDSGNLWVPTGGPVIQPFAAYRASVVISVAGYEATAQINATNFIATQRDVNDAIIAAINSVPEVKKLVSAQIGTSNQDLIVRALIDGVNEASLTIRQPELVTGTVATGTSQVTLGGDANALAAALIATNGRIGGGFSFGTAADSAEIAGRTGGPLAEDVAWYFQDHVANNDYAGYSNTWYAGGGNDGGTTGHQANNSVIDMGPGANDLVVLSAWQGGTDPWDMPASQNTLVFSAVWGKVSIVNFFDEVTTAEMLSNGPGNQVNGNHLLDFKAFLTNQETSSGSALSAKAVPIVVDDHTGTDLATGTATLSANNIVVVTVDQLEALATSYSSTATATNYTLAGLTEATMKTLIEGDANGFTYGAQPASDGDDVGALAIGTTTRKSLIFVENIDDETYEGLPSWNPLNNDANDQTSSSNYGEYKVFEVTYGLTAEANDSTVTVRLLGTLDFGDSLELGTLQDNLVGGAAYAVVGP